MPELPDDALERERVIVAASVAACAGAEADDPGHEREVRRVRAVIDAIRGAR